MHDVDGWCFDNFRFFVEKWAKEWALCSKNGKRTSLIITWDIVYFDGSNEAWQAVRQLNCLICMDQARRGKLWGKWSVTKDLYLSGVATCETSRLFDLYLSIEQGVASCEASLGVGLQRYALQALSQVRTSEQWSSTQKAFNFKHQLVIYHTRLLMRIKIKSFSPVIIWFINCSTI